MLFSLLMLRTILGNVQIVTSELWKWILPNIVPFVTLVTSGVLVAHREDKNEPVDGYVFYVSIAASMLYLVTLFLILVISPQVQHDTDEGAFLRNTNLFLAPLQTVVTAALGIFFIKQKTGRRSVGKAAGADKASRQPKPVAAVKAKAAVKVASRTKPVAASAGKGNRKRKRLDTDASQIRPALDGAALIDRTHADTNGALNSKTLATSSFNSLDSQPPVVARKTSKRVRKLPAGDGDGKQGPTNT